jgi:hypothetical protein
MTRRFFVGAVALFVSGIAGAMPINRTHAYNPDTLTWTFAEATSVAYDVTDGSVWAAGGMDACYGCADMRVVKLSSSLDRIFDRLYSPTFSSEMAYKIVAKNGSAWVCGVDNYTTTPTGGYLMKLDGSGAQVWKQHLWGYNGVRDIAIDPVDGGIWAVYAEMFGWWQGSIAKYNQDNGDRVRYDTYKANQITDIAANDFIPLCIAVDKDYIYVGGYVTYWDNSFNNWDCLLNEGWRPQAVIIKRSRTEASFIWKKVILSTENMKATKVISLDVKGGQMIALVSVANSLCGNYTTRAYGINAVTGSLIGSDSSYKEMTNLGSPPDLAIVRKIGEVRFHPSLPLALIASYQSFSINEFDEGGLVVSPNYYSTWFDRVQGVCAVPGTDASIYCATMNGWTATEKFGVALLEGTSDFTAKMNIVATPTVLDRSQQGATVTITLREIDKSKTSRVLVFDSNGRQVAFFDVKGDSNARGAVVWDGTRRDSSNLYNGKPLAPGVYFITVEGGKGDKTKVLILNKRNSK